MNTIPVKLSALLLGAALIYMSVPAQAQDLQTYTYTIRSGDTLSELALLFTGSVDTSQITNINNMTNADLIYANKKIQVPPSKPIALLKQYLTLIYDGHQKEAYTLLSSDTKTRFSYKDFAAATEELTFFDLETIEICAHTVKDGVLLLRLKLQIEEDPATWGFNLIQEGYKWRVLLLDLKPTFPQDSGGLNCK